VIIVNLFPFLSIEKKVIFIHMKQTHFVPEDWICASLRHGFSPSGTGGRVAVSSAPVFPLLSARGRSYPISDMPQPKAFLPCGADSLTWKINRERLVLLAGPAAAVLQVAHPMVARGVAAHSNFRSDSTGRLHRTLEAVYTVAFGTADQVEKVRASVTRSHRAVKGEGYSAFDPDAQLWVLATLIMGSVTMYERFVAPLTHEERNRFLVENENFALVFGMDPAHVWKEWTVFENYWNGMLQGPELGSLPVCGDVARAVICPDSPWFMRSLSPVFRALSLELIPSDLSSRLGLGGSALRKPLWWLLDQLIPRLLSRVPRKFRFPIHYLHAVRRQS